MHNSAINFRFTQAVGKIRRFYKATFRPRASAKLVELRHGDCNRCGRCCKILFRCPFLREDGDTYSCRIYGYHFSACKLFPLEQRDINELGGDCTYYFTNPPAGVHARPGDLKQEPRERLWQIS